MHVSNRIKGHLDQGWQQGLEGLQIVHEENGTSLLTGVLKDQAALFGVLKRIDYLSLTLLSLERSDQGRLSMSSLLGQFETRGKCENAGERMMHSTRHEGVYRAALLSLTGQSLRGQNKACLVERQKTGSCFTWEGELLSHLPSMQHSGSTRRGTIFLHWSSHVEKVVFRLPDPIVHTSKCTACCGSLSRGLVSSLL
jgi:hypothetical protein